MEPELTLSTERLARAVDCAVFNSMMLAIRNPEQAERWLAHADKIHCKFFTQYGKHYSHFIPDCLREGSRYREVLKMREQRRVSQ